MQIKAINRRFSIAHKIFKELCEKINIFSSNEQRKGKQEGKSDEAKKKVTSEKRSREKFEELKRRACTF